MASSETPRSIPWYKRFREEFQKASKYIHAVEHTDIKPETLKVFDKETLVRFIFESNNLEREGLPLGETKELVILGLDEHPELIQANDEQRQNLRELVNLVQDVKKSIPIDFGLLSHSILKDRLKFDELQLGKSYYKLIAKHGNKNKEGNKVIRYFIATLDADAYALRRSVAYYDQQAFIMLQTQLKAENLEEREDAQNFLREIFADEPPIIESLITEERIKSLHGFMADGLIDEKSAKAGQYRTKPIMTDIDSHYPAPEDVSTAMANFVAKYQEFESQNLNPIALAAWASTQFVLIHPFSDFNGRLSRLLMNMIFRAHGVPFWVSLRSSGKERTRYLMALKKCRERNYLPIATLISMQLNRNFEDFNNILELAGYSKITIDDMEDFSSELSDNEIYLHDWEHRL